MPPPLLPFLLLVGTLAILWRALRRGGRPRVWPFDEGEARRASYRRTLGRAGWAFLLPSVAGLAVLGRLDTLLVMPPEFAGVAAFVGPLRMSDALLFGAGLAGGIGGALVGTLWSIRRGRRGLRGPMLGDVGALLPQHRGELPYGAAVSLVAGVTEEPLFRLYLPLLIALVTGSAVAGFGLAALLFAYAHRYQGWRGVAGTGVMGLLFTGLYLASGKLWVAIGFHVLLNLMGLVVRPAMTGAWRSVLEPPAGAEYPGDHA